MEQKMKYDKFREKFDSWAEKFKPFIEGKEFWDIYQVLKADTQKEMIVPKREETFRAFTECRAGDLRVLFYLQDPYTRLYKDGTPQACGIAMDCRNSPDGKLQPSLELWYDAIDRFLEDEKYPEGYSRIDNPRKCLRTPNLGYLHEQGVMLLNTDLTCKKEKTGSHEGLWKPFQKYFLQEVMTSYTGIIYVLCGKSSHGMEKFINPLGNYIFKLEHPAAAAHRGDNIWRDQNIFSKINRILVDNYGKHYKIWWDKKDWEFYKDPPF